MAWDGQETSFLLFASIFFVSPSAVLITYRPEYSELSEARTRKRISAPIRAKQ